MSRLVSAPIENPALPFVTNIPGGVKVGLIIRIQGKVVAHAKRFEINLATGPEISLPNLSPIAFHFNPRFKYQYVARNTLINGSWGPEEDSAPSHIPFCQNQAFEIMILIESHQYKVAVDGTHFLEYNHRIPINEVTTLQIMGDVTIYKVEILDSIAASPVLGFQGLAPSQTAAQEFINPTVPVYLKIPNELRVGGLITITGRPKPYAKRFSINFEGFVDERKVCYFHFNPRFGGLGDETQSVVVRNTLKDDEWGIEERDTPVFPFYGGFNFDILVLCEEESFLVAVNGQHLLTYKHRLPFNVIESLAIEGDVDIMLVKFH